MSEFIHRRIAKLEAHAEEFVREGKDRHARDSLEDVCRLTRRYLDEKNPRLVGYLDLLAEINLRLGDEPEARRCYEEAARRLQAEIDPRLLTEDATSKEHGLEAARQINRFARLQWCLGRHDTACRLLQQALVLSGRALGVGHPDFAILLSNLGEVYQSSGELDKAESYYRRALKILGETLGREHPEFLRSLFDLLSMYDELDVL
jgi:tetratricopeptide (TPR) repeat protein